MPSMVLLKPDKLPFICKGEWCMSCLNKAQDQKTEEGVIIICSLELRKAGVNELDAQTQKCPSWQLDPDADMITDEDVELEEEDETGRQQESLDTPESIRHYVFVGDSLVSDPRKTEESLRLTTSFVERYNVLVQMSKSAATRKVEEIEGDIEERLTKAREAVKEQGIDADIEPLFADGVIDYLREIHLQDENDLDNDEKEEVSLEDLIDDDEDEDDDLYEDEDDLYEDDDDEDD